MLLNLQILLLKWILYYFEVVMQSVRKKLEEGIFVFSIDEMIMEYASGFMSKELSYIVFVYYYRFVSLQEFLYYLQKGF